MVQLLLALSALVGSAVAVALVAFYGLVEIGGALVGVGWGVLALAAFHLVQMTFSALGWRSLLPRAVASTLPAVLRIRWIREAVNNLLPVAQIGGEFLGARLLQLRGVPLAVGGASVTVDLTMEMASQIVFTLLGLTLLIPGLQDARLSRWMLAGAALATAIVVGFVTAQRFGFFQLVERALVRLGQKGGWSSLGEIGGLHQAILALYASPARLAAAFCCHLVSWLLGGFEIMLALHLVGVAVDFRDGLIIESLGHAVRAVGFAVPASLGIQEGGYVLICGLLGVNPQAAIELSLLKRIRELVLGVPALVFWQVLEGRRLAEHIGGRTRLTVAANGD
jgi:putative membrane protein